MSQKTQVIPVILCGGSGTRLWPLSRAGLPKQFLSLTGKATLFQEAIMRSQAIASSEIEIAQTMVITNEEHRFLATEQLRELEEGSSQQCPVKMILEPVGKNTAPALTLAAMATEELSANSENTDPILLVTPADQAVKDSKQFVSVIQSAIAKAKEGLIVVMGIEATRPETGYGYIKQAGIPGRFGEYAVEQFFEKPNKVNAEEYLKSGEYSWNAGIFVLKASIWLQVIQEFRTDIYTTCERAYQNKKTDTISERILFIRPNQKDFEQIPSESIDCAVIEKCPNSAHPIVMLPLQSGWDDLGSWDAVWQAGEPNGEGNVLKGDVLAIESKNSLILATSRLVSLVGVEDLIIVETPDAVLVANRKKSQIVKAVVSQLEKEGRKEKNIHRKVMRPWGWYDSVDHGENYKVKHIQVKTGASLSLQLHRHRAEHWVIVRGVAEVTNGDQVMIFNENQSVYIPKGSVHRLSNIGSEPLEIIEVQTGRYLEEDDIERLEDNYGRAK